MYLRVDKLQIELPKPAEADPASAGVVQESLGGKFGEMSTLMNYTYQSFNMRGKSKVRPYYDLIANIAAEELGHIELVANTINLLLDQTEASTDGVTPPLNFSGMTGNPNHFLNYGLGAIPGSAAGKAWTGENVFNSGNRPTPASRARSATARPKAARCPTSPPRRRCTPRTWTPRRSRR